MSYQAQEAVLRHSQQTNLNHYKLLQYIASRADADGACDPAPMQETIAEEFGVSKRTIRNWIASLIASGELERTREGKGSGNASAYQITLPIGKTGNKTGKPETKPEANPDFLSGIYHELRSLRAEIDDLKAQVAALQGKPETKPENRKQNRKKPETKPEKTGNKTGKNRKGALEVERTRSELDPISIRKERGSPQTPLTDASETPEQIAIWESTQDLVRRWASSRNIRRRLNPQDRNDADYFYRPVAGLLVDLGGDTEKAWQLMANQYERMLRDGLTPIRAGPVIEQIYSEWERAGLKPPTTQADEPERVGGVY